MSMADRIVVLSEGRILQIASPEELYRKPAIPKVAKQLGQPAINLLRAEKFAPGMFPSGALVGIRPEAIECSGGQTEATVKVVENMGPMQVVLADWLVEAI